MKLHVVLPGIILLSTPLSCLAGGGVRPTTLVGKRSLPQETRFQQLLSAHMDRAILNSSQTARLAHVNRAAFFRSVKTLPFQAMATLSAPAEDLNPADPLFALRNDRAAFPWFETIEKDLSFLRSQHHSIRKTIRIRRQFPQDIDYTTLIPPDVRKIYIGEEHSQPVIYQAVEKLLFQYKNKYPDRQIILLTEFVSDRLFPWQMPGKPVSRLEIPIRRNDRDFVFFNKFLKAGIQIIGLENISYIKDHEALITPSQSQAESVVGMQDRNAHWRRIISHVAEKNPQATLFIYTGSMHSHYRAPFTLANPSPQNFVLQLESKALAPDMPFGFVMQKEKFVRARGEKAMILTWSEKDPVYRTRSGFDACIIFPEN